MERSGRGSVVVLVVAILALAGLGYWAFSSPEHVLGVALLVAIPLFAAIFLSFALTAVVSILTIVVAAGVAYTQSNGTFDGYLIPLAAVAVSAVVAIVSAMARRSPAGSSTPKEPKPPKVKRRKGDAAAEDGAGPEIPEDVNALGEPIVDLRPKNPADTDQMTGLLNRRGAIRALGSRNPGSDKVLAFMDCDLFRTVNDTYGTAVGDEFLQAIAGRLRHSLPASDTVARWDGDEFLAVVATTPGNALTALERVVGGVNAHPIRTGAGPIDSSMSVGAAVWLSGQDLEDAISRAGRALHTAKSGGQGQVVLDPGPGSPPHPTGLPDASPVPLPEP